MAVASIFLRSRITKNKFLTFFLFGLLSLFLLILYIPVLKTHTYSASFGDYPIYIDPLKELKIRLSAYNSSFAGGVSEPFNLALLFPQYSLYLLLQVLGVTPFFSTVFYLVLMILCGLISMYLLLEKLNNTSKFLISIYSILYVFSPYFLTYQHPGHFGLLTLFYSFPLLLLLVVKLIQNFRRAYLIQIFLVGLFLSSSIANISYLIILLIALSSLSLVFISKRKQIAIMLFALITLILANSFWLIPSVDYFLRNYTSQVANSKQNLGAALNIAVENSSISNILLGQIELEQLMLDQSFSKTILLLISAIYSYIFYLAILSIIRGSKKYHLSIFLYILGFLIYIIKATHPPFSSFFNIAYVNIPIMQIFRRPQSKLYWLFFFIVITLAFLYSNTKKLTTFHRSILLLSAILFIFISFSNRHLVYFNIPNEYHQAKLYLDGNAVNKILFLPNLHGKPISYGQNLNRLTGVDFMTNYFDYPVLANDFLSKNSLPPLLNKKIENLINLLEESSNKNSVMCDELSQLGVTHIVLRKSINKIDTNQIKSSLSNIKTIISKTAIDNKEVTIYSVAKACTDKPHYSSNKIVLNLPFVKVYLLNSPINIVEIKLLENYDSRWITIAVLENGVVQTDSIHSLLYGYANEWKIVSQKSKIKQIIIIHSSQIYFYLGMLITIIYFLLLLCTKNIYFFQENVHE